MNANLPKHPRRSAPMAPSHPSRTACAATALKTAQDQPDEWNKELKDFSCVWSIKSKPAVISIRIKSRPSLFPLFSLFFILRILCNPSQHVSGAALFLCCLHLHSDFNPDLKAVKKNSQRLLTQHVRVRGAGQEFWHPPFTFYCFPVLLNK